MGNWYLFIQREFKALQGSIPPKLAWCLWKAGIKKGAIRLLFYLLVHSIKSALINHLLTRWTFTVRLFVTRRTTIASTWTTWRTTIATSW